MKLLLFLFALPLAAQTTCPATPVFSICEITFPGLAQTPDLKGEFRSPLHKTYLVPAFWDGSQMAIRVSPTEPGTWDFRITDGRQGRFTATASGSQGFIEVANTHHFWYSGSHQAHLWMGDTVPALGRAAFENYVDARAAYRFNHLRLTLLVSTTLPDDAYWRDMDARINYINRKGITVDLVIAKGGNAFATIFPEREQREKFMKFLVARYGAMNITWQCTEDFETNPHGRELMKELGGYLKSLDQYHHPISTGTLATSSPLFDDQWMNYLTYRSPDGTLPAIEHQMYKAPGVVDFRGNDKFRQRLWSSTMTGAYPESSAPDDEAAQQMKVWFDVMAETRHWDLEPFFDAGGARALALEGVEYIIYIENPGPVNVTVEKHSYEMEWINPLTGEVIALKNLKQETFSGETPDRAHDWILHISREGEKKSMSKSYRFEAREVLMQEIDSDPGKVPFEITEPSADTLSLLKSGPFAVKIKKETRATKAMQYMWTGEVNADEQSFRVVGTGPNGILVLPSNLALKFPALLHLRVAGMNLYGKVFTADRNVTLTSP